MLDKLDVLIREIEEEPWKRGFKCEKYEKLCKSNEGLSRHQNFKHKKIQPGQEEGGTSTAVENRLNPAYFKDYINHCPKQLATDACYSDETVAVFTSYECSLDDAVYTYQFVRVVIEIFDGDGEKFYSLFYDIVSGDDIVFKNLNRKCSVILGFKVANSVLAHFNGAITPEISFSIICELTEKERSSTKYISGYVMKTMHCCLGQSREHCSDSTKFLNKIPQQKMRISLMLKTEVAFEKFLLVFLKFFLWLRSILNEMFQTKKKNWFSTNDFFTNDTFQYSITFNNPLKFSK